MKFVIKRNGKMQNVGARPKIYALANKNGVQVIPRNTADGNIEVIAKGSKENIELFWECVKEAEEADLRPLAKKDDGYEVEEPELYSPDDNEPDLNFTYFAGSNTMEQVSKGTHYLGSIDDKLDTLPKDIAKELDSRLNTLPKDIAKELDSRLNTLPKDIAKELAKELRREKI